MFLYDRGLRLSDVDLAIDIPRRQPCGFISHAHADHMARHELALCTPATARLYQHRLGERATREMPFGRPLRWGPLRLTTHPAGHVLGSAMLRVERDDGASLLYTGDFRLGESETCHSAEPPRADALVMESTYGDPEYRLPPRDQARRRLISLVEQALSEGETPVVRAYALGKAQQVTRILTDAGFRVALTDESYAICQIYEELGQPLGPFECWASRPADDLVLVTPPRGRRAANLAPLGRLREIVVTGWAVGGRVGWARRASYAAPLSDHADFDGLLELIDLVRPRRVYCTHGPRTFVDHLRARGVLAESLDDHTPADLLR